MICPKCGYERTDKDDPLIPDYQCPSCGIVYHKFKKQPLIEGPAVFEADERPRHYISSEMANSESSDTNNSKSSDRNTFFGKQLTSAQSLLIIFLFVLVAFFEAIYRADTKKLGKPSTSPEGKILLQQTTEPKTIENHHKTEEAEERQRQREIKQQQREAACQADANCSAQKAFTAESSVNCQRNIERMARYRFKWTDGWLESKFNMIMWKDSARTVLHVSGGYLELENGFGAWQPYRYVCEVRASDNQVIDIKMAPGR